VSIQAEKLADAVETLHHEAVDQIIRSDRLQRGERELLLKTGFVEQIMRGWLLVTHPSYPPGATAPWFSAYWAFISQYLEDRFGTEYCLSAEESVKRHVESPVIPRQIIVAVKARDNNLVTLLHGTSLLISHSTPQLPKRSKLNGIQVMDLAAAICQISEPFYRNNPNDAELALRMIRSASVLLDYLLEGNNSVVAGRLVGAYEFLGNSRMAAEIRATMEAAGNRLRVTNPFSRPEPVLGGSSRVISPHVARIQGLWKSMRNDVIEIFSEIPVREIAASDYMAEVDTRYVADAYNSLSIEGYRVTPELIERVRAQTWNPEANDEDSQQRDALAARGYYLAFQSVKSSIARVLEGEKTADVIDRDFQGWYRELFSPSVQAGILEARQLSGYRNNPVYLRGSRYVPPQVDAVTDCMEAFFELLQQETEPVVRAVLGHFIFVYIHPYPDGNGRLGRFLMNAGFASGRYAWTVVRNSRRDLYLTTLEEASTNHNIRPLAAFLAEEMLAT